MATILDEEPVWFTSRRSKYNWDEWLDGKTYHLKKGTPEQVDAGEADFAVASSALRSAAQNAAKARGLKLKAKITPEGDVILRATRELRQIHEAEVHEDA